MKKMILSLVALMTAMSMNAQVVDVYQGTDATTPTATYTHTSTNKVKVNFKKGTDGEQVVIANGSETVTYNNTSEKPLKVVFHPATDEINGHKYVEIGGIKWATMNVGATSVADDAATAYGDYYAWGETATYYSNISWSGSTPTFTWKDTSNDTDTHMKAGKSTGYAAANYTSVSGSGVSATMSEWSPTPYSSSTNTLESDYDVAAKQWGGSWRMPTSDEFLALYNACSDEEASTSGKKTGKITKSLSDTNNTISDGGVYRIAAGITVDGTKYNVAGLLFISKTDKTKRVFFPAAGNVSGTTSKLTFTISGSTTSYGLLDYWTSSYKSSSRAYCFGNINSSDVLTADDGGRNVGHTVRPVSD